MKNLYSKLKIFYNIFTSENFYPQNHKDLAVLIGKKPALREVGFKIKIV